MGRVSYCVLRAPLNRMFRHKETPGCWRRDLLERIGKSRGIAVTGRLLVPKQEASLAEPWASGVLCPFPDTMHYSYRASGDSASTRARPPGSRFLGLPWKMEKRPFFMFFLINFAWLFSLGRSDICRQRRCFDRTRYRWESWSASSPQWFLRNHLMNLLLNDWLWSNYKKENISNAALIRMCVSIILNSAQMTNTERLVNRMEQNGAANPLPMPHRPSVLSLVFQVSCSLNHSALVAVEIYKQVQINNISSFNGKSFAHRRGRKVGYTHAQHSHTQSSISWLSPQSLWGTRLTRALTPEPSEVLTGFIA